MSQKKGTSLKQKLHSLTHREKIDTTHMTGKNTTLPAVRSAANSSTSAHSNTSNAQTSVPLSDRTAGMATSTTSTHFDRAQHYTDPVVQNPDHIIRQDSEEGLTQNRGFTQSASYPGQFYNAPTSVDQSTFGKSASVQYGQNYNTMQAPLQSSVPMQSTTQTFTSTTMAPSVEYSSVRAPLVSSTEQMNTQTVSSSMAPSTVTATVLPDTVERVDKPAVVHEVIREMETVEVQPVIERSRDRVDVEYIIAPIRQREVLPVEVREVMLAPRMLPILRETNVVQSGETETIQVVQTVTVPITQTVSTTTTRMMSAQEAVAYQPQMTEWMGRTQTTQYSAPLTSSTTQVTQLPAPALTSTAGMMTVQKELDQNRNFQQPMTYAVDQASQSY